jgi:hypothetical protein
VRVFRSSVPGIRPSASIRYRVPGPRCQVGTRDLAPNTWRNVWLILRKPAQGDCPAYPVCGFFEAGDGHSAWCPVPGTRYRVPAIWHLGPGTRHRSRIDAEGRTPSTEDRARPPENAHTGFASRYSHSMVAGGLDVTSRTTRLTPRTSLTIRAASRRSSSSGRYTQSAVIPSWLSTMRRAITWA